MNLKDHPSFPFNVKRIPFFYGWIILLAATVGVLMSIPGQTMGVSVFTDYLIDSLQIDRTSLSLAYLFGTLGSAFMITRAGKFYDRYGARVMAVTAGLMLGVVLGGLSQIDKMFDWFFGLFNNANRNIFGIIFLMLGFFGIRFFGQGILTMTSRNMLMKWFVRRRGLVNGIMGIFVAFGFAYAPMFLDDLIGDGNWQQAWWQMAMASAVIFVLFALIIFRDNPGDCGLIADGKEGAEKVKKRLKYRPDKQYTLKEAHQTFPFWIYTLSLALNSLYVTALTFHIVSIFGEAGFSRETAVSIFLPISVVSVTFNLVGGLISDYIKLKYLLILNLIGLITTTLAFTLLGEFKGAIYFIIAGNGICWGMFSVLNSVTWPRFYGTKHLGAISGSAMSWNVIGSAIGPFAFSLSHKVTESYYFAGGVCVVMAIVLLILSFKADNVNEKRPSK